MFVSIIVTIYDRKLIHAFGNLLAEPLRVVRLLRGRKQSVGY